MLSDGKLLVDDADRTNVPYVYAIGDIAHGGYRKELTPVAIEAGVLLARRLFANATVLVRTCATSSRDSPRT